MKNKGQNSLKITGEFSDIRFETKRGQEIIIHLCDGDLEIGIKDLLAEYPIEQSGELFYWYKINYEGGVNSTPDRWGFE